MPPAAWPAEAAADQDLPAPQSWRIPLGGNHFRTDAGALEPAASRGGRVGRNGVLAWSDPAEVHSLFFHVDRPGRLQLALELTATDEPSRVRVRRGDQVWDLELDGQAGERILGEIEVAQVGYVQIELQGLQRTGPVYAGVSHLWVRSATDGLQVHFVRDNEGNMFYWGRRGPSVHLTYTTPRQKNIEYAYSEITVPVGEDPLGSYFMANGFAEGYFGIQVNSETERRILFSVWSPFQTDNPRDIPADQRIEALEAGPEVRIGEFGNEGSGGQSYRIYPWQAGRTYRFLTRIVPDGQGSTIYTAWFGSVADDDWSLIARFRRPQTDTYLRRFHSFLENFNPATGHQHRRARHHNVWVRDTEGRWHACSAARFSVDATGGGGHRLDFNGGVEGEGWFLENCGFFSGSTAAGTVLTPPSLPTAPPRLVAP
jgi:hypothetical protein